MRPEISDLVSNLLYNSVEQDLQAAVPSAFSSIRFSRAKCHLGSTPFHMHRIKTKVDERFSKELGKFICIRLLGDLMLNSNCEVDIVVPLIQTPQTFGRMLENLGCRLSATELTLGASHVKVSGRLVVELYQLVFPQVANTKGSISQIPCWVFLLWRFCPRK